MYLKCTSKQGQNSPSDLYSDLQPSSSSSFSLGLSALCPHPIYGSPLTLSNSHRPALRLSPAFDAIGSEVLPILLTTSTSPHHLEPMARNPLSDEWHSYLSRVLSPIHTYLHTYCLLLYIHFWFVLYQYFLWNATYYQRSILFWSLLQLASRFVQHPFLWMSRAYTVKSKYLSHYLP